MTKQHNYGIDLLRIVLMFLIITGHLFVHTNIRSELIAYSPKWIFTWFYQTIIVCAVNCFVLITGYFSNVNRPAIYVKKNALLYGQVLFYSITIYVILALLGKTECSIVGTIHAALPFASGQYWFFSSFLLLRLLMPFLNHMLSRLNDYCLKALTAIIIIVFYMLPFFSIVFMQFDPTEGMGIIGFISLYIIGFSLKQLKINLSKTRCIIGLFINCFVVFVSKTTLTYVVNVLQIDAGSGLLYHYNSIFQLINAVLLLLLFKQMAFKGRIATVLASIGSSIFGIYLLHEHPAIRKVIWNAPLHEALLQTDLLQYICIVVFLPLLLLVLCLILDKTRHFVATVLAQMEPICKVNKWLTKIEEKVEERFEEPQH